MVKLEKQNLCLLTLFLSPTLFPFNKVSCRKWEENPEKIKQHCGNMEIKIREKK
jgi:hypothetical protein